MAELERLVVAVEADIAPLRAGLRRAQAETRGFEQRLKRSTGTALVPVGARREANNLRQALSRAGAAGQQAGSRISQAMRRSSASAGAALASFRSMRGALVALGGALLVREAVQAADAWTLFGNRLETLLGSAEEAGDELERLFGVAQRTRSDLGATVETFTRMAMSMETTGLNADQTRTLVEGLNAGFINTGVSTQEAANGLRQLGQAFQSGRLQGDELRSVMENMGPVARDIARELGFTGKNAIGEFREAASSAEISIEQIAKAMHNALLPQIDRLETSSKTVGQAMTQFRNALMRAVAMSNEASGTTDELAGAIDDLRKTVQDPAFQQGLAVIGQGIAFIAREAAEGVGALGRFAAAVRDLDVKGAAREIVSRTTPVGFLDRTFGTGIEDFLFGERPTDEGTETPSPRDRPSPLEVPDAPSGEEDDKGAKRAAGARKQIDDMITSLRQEAEAMQVNAGERQKFIAIQQAENIAREGNIRLTRENREEIELFADSIRAIEIQEFTDELSRENEELQRLLEASRQGEEAFSRVTAEINAENIVLSQNIELESEAGRRALELARANEGLAEATAEAATAMQEGQALFEATRTPAERYRQTIERLNELLAEGAIDQETFTRAAEQAREELERTDEALRSQAELYGNISHAATHFFDAVVSESSSAGEALRDLAMDMSQIGFEKFALGPLENFLNQGMSEGGGSLAKLFGGGSSGGGAASSGATVAEAALESIKVFHKGGVVGSANVPSRVVPASVFANAPRFHTGLMPRLASDEQAAILQKGETVLPKGSSRGQSITVNINGVTDADSFQRSGAQVRNQIGRAVTMSRREM